MLLSLFSYLTWLSAGEFLAASIPFLDKKIHPITIISSYKKALEDALALIPKFSKAVDTDNREEMLSLIKSSLNTKFVSQWSDLMCGMALDAVKTVAIKAEKTEVDIKRFARVEKVLRSKNHSN